MKLSATSSIVDLYGPAMDIEDPAQAREYWEALVTMRMETGLSRAEAEACERQNLGYFTGYCDEATGKRVARVFGVLHPFLGTGDGVTVLPPDFLRP